MRWIINDIPYISIKYLFMETVLQIMIDVKGVSFSFAAYDKAVICKSISIIQVHSQRIQW